MKEGPCGNQISRLTCLLLCAATFIFNPVRGNAILCSYFVVDSSPDIILQGLYQALYATWGESCGNIYRNRYMNVRTFHSYQYSSLQIIYSPAMRVHYRLTCQPATHPTGRAKPLIGHTLDTGWQGRHYTIFLPIWGNAIFLIPNKSHAAIFVIFLYLYMYVSKRSHFVNIRWLYIISM